MAKVTFTFLVVILFISLSFSSDTQKLSISSNNRFLVKEDGSPFVWIGATMWKWKNLSIEKIQRILDDHASKGYNVIQLIAYPDEYDTVDEIVDYAATRDIYIGMVTGWYRDVLRGNPPELYKRGYELGYRYRNRNNIIWLTAGEAGGHHRKGPIPDEKLNALVKGIRDGDTGCKLLTVHADYKRGTSLDNDLQIVDFNNWQTSQWCCPADLPRHDKRNWTVWDATSYDYSLLPPKPTLDAEAWYEKNKDHCGATPFHIRRRACFTILAGAFGHTYGAGGMWDGLKDSLRCSGNWRDALLYDGYVQIGYLGRFFRGLGDDFLKLVPDQSLILKGNSDNYDTHIQAAMTKNSSLALIYSGSDAAYIVNMGKLTAQSVSARWYDPRNNEYRQEKNSPYTNNKAARTFDPPGDSGPGNDWILMLGNIPVIKD